MIDVGRWVTVYEGVMCQIMKAVNAEVARVCDETKCNFMAGNGIYLVQPTTIEWMRRQDGEIENLDVEYYQDDIEKYEEIIDDDGLTVEEADRENERVKVILRVWKKLLDEAQELAETIGQGGSFAGCMVLLSGCDDYQCK